MNPAVSPILRAIIALGFLFPDPHPIARKRIESQLEQLNSDLKQRNLSPSMRKELEEKIKETRKAIKGTIKHDGTITGLGPYIINLYNYFIEPFAPVEYVYDKYCDKTDSANIVNKKMNEIYKGKSYDEKGELITNGNR
jgi:hypothetical protein